MNDAERAMLLDAKSLLTAIEGHLFVLRRHGMMPQTVAELQEIVDEIRDTLPAPIVTDLS